ncbi:transcriptional activator of glycolytic enzymes domain-containing protein [Trichoderma breve]|uniref:Transcriptional activator of glycolytic enzymes domain-containing protein n=1 Tax=Trichoderma breve TaxID=2034170 RepID=A0A9W9E8M8_9HYPO|nr:transcriptional activator of glycolytic enzymes domain-containing protein [Trichoderma breve]KAJ4862114.1 transcriptional activator of glycolytic enzymes domain-containing protein [Trichoderma breve]
MTANLALSCSNNYSCPSKSPLALRTRKTRSTAPSARSSVPSVSAPNVLPGDPPGSEPYLRGVGLRPGRANRRISPKKSIVPIVRNKKDNDPKCADESETVVAVDVLDYLPMEVAKMVINMQQYYAAGVEELMGKLGSMSEEVRLARKENEELLEKLAGLSEDVVLEREESEEMRRRLDMHFVMLRQANKFMQSVRDGSLGGVEGVDVPTLVEEEEEEEEVSMRGLDMEVPPVPSVDREPVRSTGRKVPKRRAGGNYGLRRRGKRQTRMKKTSTAEKGVHFEGGSDAMDIHQAEEEAAPQERDDEDDEDDDHLKILAGAPRLQAMLRKSAWTAINHHPNNTDPNADYRPHSPSSASESSSSPSPRSPSPTPLPRRPQTPTITTPTKPSSSSPTKSPPSSSSSRPRYSTPRHTTLPRYASGPPSRPFRFHRMGRTVLDVWTEYKHGKKGNPAIEALERQYATGWRTGTLREIKYASNYVGVRQKVVSKVEEICAREGIEPEEACRRLDERVDGRMQMLITAVRKGEDPFEVIPKR